ncbi:MAG: cytochrome c oxidase subunit II [Limnochorda sp.]|uniref:cytochrome c oxidase subunit II n=1 Tax=Limnochorda sp. TaxID=1940279 RepID=UPI0039C15AFF
MSSHPTQPQSEKRLGRATALLIWLILALAVASSAYALRHWWSPPLINSEAAGIDRLFSVLWILLAAVFVGVQALLGYFVFRYADRGEGRASYEHENLRLEIAWTALPAVLLVVLTVLGGGLWLRVQGAAPPEAATVQVVAQQFGWTFHYPGPDDRFGPIRPMDVAVGNPIGLDREGPGADDVVAGELHVVVGQPVRLLLTSRDVIHSFYVPELRLKQDAVPGRVTEVWFTPTQPGVYEIACAELCGAGHYLMAARMVVETEAEYQAWLASQNR